MTTITLYAADGSIIRQWKGTHDGYVSDGYLKFKYEDKKYYLSGTYVLEEDNGGAKNG